MTDALKNVEGGELRNVKSSPDRLADAGKSLDFHSVRRTIWDLVHDRAEVPTPPFDAGTPDEIEQKLREIYTFAASNLTDQQLACVTRENLVWLIAQLRARSSGEGHEGAQFASSLSAERIAPEPTERVDQRALELSRAIAWSAESFGEKLDRQGKPAILHALRVMLAGQTPAERIVGVLHDVVEDCDWRVEDITDEFGDEIGHAVDCLTRRKNSTQTYADYIESLTVWPLAAAVKLHDLSDNIARSFELPKEEGESLRRRYFAAQARLLAALGSGLSVSERKPTDG